MSWTYIPTPTFKKLYRKKGHVEQSRIKVAVEALTGSRNPKQLCRKKLGKLRDCYSYDLSESSRIVMYILEDRREIQFLRVCDHKQAYIV